MKEGGDANSGKVSKDTTNPPTFDSAKLREQHKQNDQNTKDTKKSGINDIQPLAEIQEGLSAVWKSVCNPRGEQANQRLKSIGDHLAPNDNKPDADSSPAFDNVEALDDLQKRLNDAWKRACEANESNAPKDQVTGNVENADQRSTMVGRHLAPNDNKPDTDSPPVPDRIRKGSKYLRGMLGAGIMQDHAETIYNRYGIPLEARIEDRILDRSKIEHLLPEKEVLIKEYQRKTDRLLEVGEEKVKKIMEKELISELGVIKLREVMTASLAVSTDLFNNFTDRLFKSESPEQDAEQILKTIGKSMTAFQGALEYFAMGLSEHTDWEWNNESAAKEFSNIENFEKAKKEARSRGEGLPGIMFEAVMASREVDNFPDLSDKDKVHYNASYHADQTQKILSQDKLKDIEQRYKILERQWEEFRNMLNDMLKESVKPRL